MLLELLVLVVGLVLLVGGGEALVRGASALARKMGIPPLAIGLTVVAFGTSSPELAVNIKAALAGNGALSFGSIYGSNLANIGLVVGMAALFKPLPIGTILVQRELPMMLLATMVAGVLACDMALVGEPNTFDRSDGLIFLLFFAVFGYYTVGDLLRERSKRRPDNDDDDDDLVAPREGAHKLSRKWGIFGNIALALAGMGSLIYGATLTVDSASALALAVGVPDAIVGLTIVAVGTSLPELVTALVAVRRDQVDLAVGNVVGSNIFNTLLVGGAAAVAGDVVVPERGLIDLAAVFTLSVTLLIAAYTDHRRIIRTEAGALVLMYAVYMIWRSTTAG